MRKILLYLKQIFCCHRFIVKYKYMDSKKNNIGRSVMITTKICFCPKCGYEVYIQTRKRVNSR
jgi:hypothetical protein